MSQPTSLSFKSSKQDLHREWELMETGTKEARIRRRAISASLSCPSQPPFTIPSSSQEGTLTIKHLWELRTPPQEDTEKFKHTYFSRLPSEKGSQGFLTGTVVYWSKLVLKTLLLFVALMSLFWSYYGNKVHLGKKVPVVKVNHFFKQRLDTESESKAAGNCQERTACKQLAEEETICPWKKTSQSRAQRKFFTSVKSASVLLRQVTFPMLNLHCFPLAFPNSTLFFFFFFSIAAKSTVQQNTGSHFHHAASLWFQKRLGKCYTP